MTVNEFYEKNGFSKKVVIYQKTFLDGEITYDAYNVENVDNLNDMIWDAYQGKITVGELSISKYNNDNLFSVESSYF